MSRFVLIGHPVAHSVSPAIHRAAYAALGVSHAYELADCPDAAAVRRQVESLRAGDLGGANVTVPHKRLALELADRAHEHAEQIGAANVLAREGGEVVAHNTDAAALADELRQLVSGAQTALVIGNGGAALASVAACRAIGIERVVVIARRFRADSANWPRADELRRLGAEPTAWDAPKPPGIQLVVQATSAGMHGVDPGEAVRDVVPWDDLGARAVAYDLVYNPPSTPFLEGARARGLVAQGGLGMLVRQAALAIELWLGRAPPLEPLRQAAERALGRAA